MTTDRVPTPGYTAVRRDAIWPWLVMPMIILALFTVLHNVRRSAGGNEQDSISGPGIP
jgi:hypothetical protein